MTFLRSRSLLAVLIVSAVLLAAALVVVLANVGNLEAPLTLHAGENGADFFGGMGSLYGLWALGLVMVLINVFLGAQLYRSVRPLTFLFFGANVFLAILLLIAIGTVISLNQ